MTTALAFSSELYTMAINRRLSSAPFNEDNKAGALPVIVIL